MIKKVIFIVLLLLVSCSKPSINKEFIEPVRSVFIFSELNQEIQNRIKKANSNKEYQNYQFEMFNKDILNKTLVDIYGNKIDLVSYQDLIIEVVSVNCSHCKNQLKHISDFISNTNAKFIQYFNVGSKEEIIQMYKSENVEIPNNLTILSYDDEMLDYIKDDLKLEMYPTLLCYKNGKLTFCVDGEISSETFKLINDIAFINPIDKKDLVDENGNNVLEMNRSIDDVKNSLSKDNQSKINSLDNDGKTTELTYSNIGKKIDFSLISNDKNDLYINEIEDFSKYNNSRLVIIYLYLNKNNTDVIDMVNNTISKNKDVNYVVALMEGADSSSNVLKSLDKTFNCPVISMLERFPDELSKIAFMNYPSALFIEDSTITGIYHNIENSEKLLEAIDIFLSDNSIAYKSNN